jgi:complement component 1 Q subcomponent-binding protein
VDCSVLDGQLYDILLNLLEERGMGEEFANELADFATSYEHLQYIKLLEKLKDFSK